MTAPPDTVYLAAVGSDDQGTIWELMPEHAHEDGDPMYVLADLLSDPASVHLNMLRGTIAKPSLAQIAHIYGDEWTGAIAAAEARIAALEVGLREAERFLAYFAGETGGSFSGPGTPQSCVAAIRALLTAPFNGGDTLANVLSDLAQRQKPLGAEFEQVLEGNREELYEP